MRRSKIAQNQRKSVIRIPPLRLSSSVASHLILAESQKAAETSCKAISSADLQMISSASVSMPLLACVGMIRQLMCASAHP